MILVSDSQNNPITALPVPTPEAEAAVNAALGPWSDWLAGRAWPGGYAVGLTVPTAYRPWPPAPLRLNQMHWPTGAGRFGVGAFLARGTDLALLRNAAFGANRNQNNPLTLALSGQDQTLTTVESAVFAVYLLPPSPCYRVTDASANEVYSMYVVMFVDQRFFWRNYNVGAFSITSNTVWADLYTSISSTLGTTITPDAVPTNYFHPHPNFNNYAGVSAPLVLDAIAANCGQRIAVSYDGTVIKSLNFASSAAILTNSLALPGRKVRGGGQRPFTDLANVLPSKVKTVFPPSDCAGAPLYLQNAYVSSVPLTGLAPTYLPATPGTAPGSAVFRDACRALYPSAGAANPTNKTNLDDLTDQIALDFYNYQSISLDVVGDGILNWTPEGLSDHTVWTYTTTELSTRVRGAPFDGYPEEFLHETWDVKEPPLLPTYAKMAKTGNGGIGAGSTATVTVWDFGTGAPVVSSGSCGVTCYNPASSSVGGNKLIIMFLVDGRWVAVWEDC